MEGIERKVIVERKEVDQRASLDGSGLGRW